MHSVGSETSKYYLKVSLTFYFYFLSKDVLALFLINFSMYFARPFSY